MQIVFFVNDAAVVRKSLTYYHNRFVSQLQLLFFLYSTCSIQNTYYCSTSKYCYNAHVMFFNENTISVFALLYIDSSVGSIWDTKHKGPTSVSEHYIALLPFLHQKPVLVLLLLFSHYVEVCRQQYFCIQLYVSDFRLQGGTFSIYVQ